MKLFHSVDNIPKDLLDKPIWINWKPIERDGKISKLPICDGEPFSPAKHKGVCYKDLPNHEAVGIYLTEENRIIAIDIDNCLEDEILILEDVRKVVEYFSSHTYTEISPSGRGLRILVNGTWPKDGSKTLIKGHSVEVYKSKRFVTITGNLWGKSNNIAELQKALDRLYTIWYNKSTTQEITYNRCYIEPRVDILTQLLRWDKFLKLYNAESITDHSAADFALCCMIATKTQDPNEIDSIFRTSKLMRPKWEREQYAKNTISKAIISVRKKSFYQS